MRHPVQPLIIDKYGVVRFKENMIVKSLKNMSNIHILDKIWEGASDEDKEQLVQLFGQSLSTFRVFPFASPESIAIADTMYREKISEDKARIKWLEERVKGLEGKHNE
jgi:hypothetical protein